MTVDVDVAIVGGGVAGSALATVLARAGVAVAVVEREKRFRDRVRGDALFPWGAAEVARLGVADLLPASGARPLPIWQLYVDRLPNPPYDWRPDVPTGDVVWGVNHPGLQEALFQTATEAGAHMMRPAKAIGVARDDKGRLELAVQAEAGALSLRARLVVGADGRNSGVRRWIGAHAVPDPVHHVIGGCLVADVDLDPDAGHMARVPGEEALVFRHASGLARAYFVCAPERAAQIRGNGAAERFIAACATVCPEGAFARTRAVGPVAFFPGVCVVADRVASEGIVLVGDAAGADDPTQGKGLSLAFRDVRELSDRLLANDDWQAAIADFAAARPRWFAPLRAFAQWEGPLITDVGPAADAARTRHFVARERDPSLGGYRAIHALGPDGLAVSEAARGHYLGEDIA